MDQGIDFSNALRYHYKHESNSDWKGKTGKPDGETEMSSVQKGVDSNHHSHTASQWKGSVSVWCRIRGKEMSKHTPKKLAAKILLDKIEGFCDFSQEFEDEEIDQESLSLKFQTDFDRHLERYIRRIRKLLGGDK